MIQSLIKTTVDDLSEKMNDNWELYLDYIKKNGESNNVKIDDVLAYSSEFDLYAILYAKDIPERFHYPMMRLNGFRSPCDFDGSSLTLKLYSSDILNRIYEMCIAEKK